MSYMASTEQIRRENLNELAKMYQYFSEVQSSYDQYDKLAVKIKKKNDRSTNIYARLWAVAILIFLISALLQLITTLPLGYSVITKTPFLYGILLAIILFVMGYIVLILNKAKSSRLKRKQKQAAIILTEHYARYGYCLLGAEFTNPKIISKIYNTIKSGRADTAKEAINILLNDAHKSRVELEAIRTTNAAREAAKSANEAAAFCSAWYF